jgi:hypothetical protein
MRPRLGTGGCVMNNAFPKAGWGTGVAAVAALVLALGGAAFASCPADTNGDALVDINDVLNVLGNWGPGPFEVPAADTNGDGIVDVVDFLAVVGAWGPWPGRRSTRGRARKTTSSRSSSRATG